MARRSTRHPTIVSWRAAVRVFARIAIHSFGGPAGQIAVMHRILVEEKRWIGEARFLHALNYCMLLPGPEAMQLVTYVGWLLHRTLGGIVAGSLFVLPGFVSILALSIAYAGYRDVGFVSALFFGIKPAVLAIVFEAVLRIGRKALRNGFFVGLAVAAFAGIYGFGVPFPVLVLGAGLVGFATSWIRPSVFAPPARANATADIGSPALVDAALEAGALRHTLPETRRTLTTLAFWVTLWFAPIVALGFAAGRDSVWYVQAVFFSKAAVVTFGGAYAVLAYVAQAAVHLFGWLQPGEMLDGLGMAETTPGPLLQVVQFVGFMGAYRNAGGLEPMWAGFLASCLVTWVTFTPCFLWIFVGAPYVEALRGNKSLSSALAAITAAVVGVILNLAVWFSLHTLFAEVRTWRAGVLRLEIPDPASLRLPSLALAVLAAFLLFRLRFGMLRTLGACAVAGALAHVFGLA